MKKIHSNILFGGVILATLGLILYSISRLPSETERIRMIEIDTLYHSPTCLLIKVGTGELGYQYRYKYITQGDCIVDNALMIP